MKNYVVIGDIWSSKKKKSYFGIAVSYIDQNWKLWTNVIAVREVFFGK